MSSLSSPRLSVPMSNTTGMTRRGWMPAAAMYTASLRQYAFRVGGHEQVDVVGAQAVVAQRLLHRVRLVDRQVDPAGAAVFGAEPLDRLPAGGRGHDRQHL